MSSASTPPSGAEAPVIDPTLNASNPGSYEDLHKKTKGSLAINIFKS